MRVHRSRTFLLITFIMTTVGDDVVRVVRLLETLYHETRLPYFKAQAWSQWVWMLRDSTRKEWGLSYSGDPNGSDVCLPGGTT